MIGNVETRVGILVLVALGVLAYMGVQIGAFRFDRGSYAHYTLTFKDVSGLSRKADVKIAGVKVGWVESVTLMPEDGTMQATADVMIKKEYALYSDAYAMVRQDGLLGPKFIEIVPGDPLLRRLKSGDQLSRPSTEPVSLEELMQQFKRIASNVDEVTSSFREVIGGSAGQERLQGIVDNVQMTVQRLSSVADVLDRSMARNEEHIDNFLQLGTTFKVNLEKVTSVFDQDFGKLVAKVESTASAIEDVSIQARDGMRSITSVAEKIDEGKGLLGKLVNEDETYRDLKLAIEGFKNYLTKVDRMQIIFDSYFESMMRQAPNFQWEDSKGFFNIRIHPREDYFYQVQVVSSQTGYPKRKYVSQQYYDSNQNPIITDALKDAPILTPLAPDKTASSVDLYTRLALVNDHQTVTIERDVFRLGVQVGKIFKDIALRVGLFEGTAGAAVDVDVPFKSDKFRWVTSLELYDMNGRNRYYGATQFDEDRRPHVKWLNRMFIMRNIYATFGADDFASKRCATVFFGAGLRFGDDDIKYFMSNISGVGGTSFLSS